MSLLMPDLDDRDFQQLLEQAQEIIQKLNPDWTDLSPSDPGVVLLEVFAHLTDTMIYRLNRVPEKVYIAFLRLLGVTLHPPAAASVVLRFSHRQEASESRQTLTIPRGTRITADIPGSESLPVFVTVQATTLPSDAESVDVLAYHCEQVEAERIAIGTGRPRQIVHLSRPPVIDKTGNSLELMVGVAIDDKSTTDTDAPTIRYGNTTYQIWREIDNFSDRTGEAVYVADRLSGTILFSPSVRQEDADKKLNNSTEMLAQVPAEGREIRVWYWRGGGPDGNVAANMLTVLKDPIVGVQVTNPMAATGGRAAESVENALVRGPRELHSLKRAVTAGDFELVALQSPGVVRARAFTSAAVWSYAQRGTVEVILVPHIPLPPNSPVTLQDMQAQETDQALEKVQIAIDERRPLGTQCLVKWAKYKPISVTARVVVRREENINNVRDRVIDRLNRLLNPVQDSKLGLEGRAFGQPLRVSNIYEIGLSEPSVLYIDDVTLSVNDVPEAVSIVMADYFQPKTWYAGSGAKLFRSLNDGGGWERIFTLQNNTQGEATLDNESDTGENTDDNLLPEVIQSIQPHPQIAGLVAISTRSTERKASRLFVSWNCGESWTQVQSPNFHVEDIAWTIRDKRPVILLATDVGLYELSDLTTGGNLTQLLVDRRNQALGFYAVTSYMDARGDVHVAVAAQDSGGIFLSSRSGRSESFRPLINLQGEDVRLLKVQVDGPRAWLWAGTFAFGENAGSGCFRWELRGEDDPINGWEQFNKGWQAGSCRSLAFAGSHILAATHRSGVIHLDIEQGKDAPWEEPDVNSGLPVRDLQRGRFVTIESVAASPEGDRVMAGIMSGNERGAGRGIYRTDINIEQSLAYDRWQYRLTTRKTFSDQVTLPGTWLFVSDEHQISVYDEDEAFSDQNE